MKPFTARTVRAFRYVSLITLLSGVIVLPGCGGLQSDYIPPAIIIPSHIKSIAVKSFGNQTSVPSIGTKLWLAVSDEFIRDGRIAYTDDAAQADGHVVGTVTQYIKTALSYDVNLVATEFQLWVIMDLKFLDTTNNQYLWEEPALEQKLRYFAETESNQPGTKTEEEAREELWERFANDIVRRTIEGFGTVTSSSPRAVPHERKEIPPPKYPKSTPY